MLFFIDETWQTIAGRRVGALGAVAIPQDQYNGFCLAMYAIKKKELGASELMHSEIKGQSKIGLSCSHTSTGCAA